MKSDGTGVTALTSSNAAAGPLQYSKDGTKITYADGGGHIHIMNADGSNDHTLSNATAGSDGFPSWYPSGAKLILMYRVTGGFPPQTQIDSVNVDGTGEAAVVPNAGFFAADPQVSPDGTTLVFESSAPVGGSSPFTLFTCPLSNCTSPMNLTPITGAPFQYADPNWSFDAVPGTATGWVVMSYLDASGNLNVAKIHPNGTGFTVVTSYTCPSEAGDPSFNSDDSKITFEFDSNTGGNLSCNGQNNNAIPTFVYTAGADGSSPTSTGRNCSNIGCSPRFRPRMLYVSSSLGNDANSGTSPTNAWKTIDKVRSVLPSLVPGQDVCFRGGDTWVSTGMTGTASAQLDLPNVQGSVGAPIVLGQCVGFGSGLPVLDEANITNYCVDSMGVFPSVTKYLTVYGFECKHAVKQGVTFQTNGGMLGVTVANMYIHDTGPGCANQNGACLGNDPGGYLNQLDFEDFQQNADGVHFLSNIVKWGGGHNCLEVHYDTGAVIVQGNQIGPGCQHGSIDTKGVGSDSAQALVTQNFVQGGFASGLEGLNGGVWAPGYYSENQFANVHEHVLYSFNVAWDIALGMQFNPHNFAAGDTMTGVYYNNTIYASQGGAFPASSTAFISNDNPAGSNLDIRNNIFDGGKFTFSGKAGGTYTENHNNIGGKQGNFGYLSNGSSSLPGTDQNAVDPLYSNAASGNFALMLGSPDIGAGQAGLTTSTNIGAF